MKKFFAVLMVIFLIPSLFAGCTGTEEPIKEPVEDPAEDPVEGQEEVEVPSAALLLSGPVSDMDWNGGAYSLDSRNT